MVSSFLEELDVISTELRPSERAALLSAAPEEPEIEEETPAIPIQKRAAARSRVPELAGLGVAALAVIFSAWAWFRPAGKEAKPVPSPAPATAVAESAPPAYRPAVNDTALLLAGLPVDPGSPLSALSESAPFQRHSKEMAKFWRGIHRDTLPGIRRWREENIPAGLKANPVLYPLSGADYLNACAFFPNAREYLLLSLEPPGTIPDLTSLSEQEIEESLSAVRQTVASLASVNYLQSRVMREELPKTSFRGMVPALLLFTAGFGHSVKEVEPVMIGQTGQLAPDPDPAGPVRMRTVAGNKVPEQVRGIRIRYIDGADRLEKSLTYLQLELRNQIFSSAAPEAVFLGGLKHYNTMLKSAVYLLHGGNYSKVRDFVLETSDLLIQDDSGIPYHYFLPYRWEEHLFGTYTRAQPLGTLRNPPQQPLLAEQYQLGSRPLHFPYGYGVLWGKGRSNLMLFVKKSG